MIVVYFDPWGMEQTRSVTTISWILAPTQEQSMIGAVLGALHVEYCYFCPTDAEWVPYQNYSYSHGYESLLLLVLFFSSYHDCY